MIKLTRARKRHCSRSVKVALSNARGACLLPATNHNTDNIASSAITTFVSGKAQTCPDTATRLT